MKTNKVGRPTKYSTEIADIICEKIATSSKGIHHICDNDKRLPTPTTVFKWLGEEDKKYFADKYARAKELQAELLADEIITIADNARTGIKTVKKAGGLEVTKGDMVDRSRLQVDARKWKASKLYPKKYGEKLDVTTDGQKLQGVQLPTAIQNATFEELETLLKNFKNPDVI